MSTEQTLHSTEDTAQIHVRHPSQGILLNLQIVSEPAIVLLGYLLLILLLLLTPPNLVRVGLAFTLGVFGSGISTVAVLFPRQKDLDFVERLAFSACLSMAVGGMLGFALAGSPWGLRLWPLIAATIFYNLICYVVVFVRRAGLSHEELHLSFHPRQLLAGWAADRRASSRVITILLTLALLAGGWTLIQNLLKPAIDPPMTEFFLLGENDQTQAYPTQGRPGETLKITYGIINREHTPESYQVKALIAGAEVGAAQPVILESGAKLIQSLEFQVTRPQTGERAKVEFILYRNGKAYRTLHLWIDIVQNQ